MMKRLLLPLLILVLVLVPASVVLEGCGGTLSADQALLEKMTDVWSKQDRAGAEEIYAPDAQIFWNWGVPSDTPPEMTTGIEEIGNMVAVYPVDPTPITDDIYTYAPSADDIANLTMGYDGARYIATPVRVGRDLYMVVLEVRDGKIINQFVEAMYR
jgi:hypothetical protein